jgi:hypothetical protein
VSLNARRVLPICKAIPTTHYGDHRTILVGLTLLWSSSIFALIIGSATNGIPWRPSARPTRRRTIVLVVMAVTGTYLASVLPLYVIATAWEHRPHSVMMRLMNPVHGSLALLFGDGLVLPILIGVCTLAWTRLPQFGWFRRIWWPALSILIGALAGAWFHHSVAGAYNAYRYNSLSNIYHDIGAFWVLTASVFFLSLPVIFGKNVGWLRWIVIALMLIMGYLLWHEATYPLPAWVYHPMANMTDWDRVIHCSFPLHR